MVTPSAARKLRKWDDVWESSFSIVIHRFAMSGKKWNNICTLVTNCALFGLIPAFNAENACASILRCSSIFTPETFMAPHWHWGYSWLFLYRHSGILWNEAKVEFLWISLRRAVFKPFYEYCVSDFKFDTIELTSWPETLHTLSSLYLLITT